MHKSKLRDIQRLARAGNTDRAWQLFVSCGLSGAIDNADALSLKGRLIKDRALKADGPRRSTLLREAQSAYLQAAALRPATYPLINAATIALIAGRRDEAQRAAMEILSMLDSGAHEPETEYWLMATGAEALLLLGKVSEARQALTRAVRAAPAAWEDHASTLRHFRIILDTLKESAEWLDTLRPPPSLHYSGIIELGSNQSFVQQALEAEVGKMQPGFGFGALAAGADIITAEIIIRSGAELHVVLPASIDSFRQISVVPYGLEWAKRFDRLLKDAAVIETLPELDQVSQAGVVLASQMAMGLAICRSRTLESKACALRVVAQETEHHFSGTLDASWSANDLAIQRVAVGRAPTQGQPLPLFRVQASLAVPANASLDSLVEAGGMVADAQYEFSMISFADPAAAVRAASGFAQTTNMPVGADYFVFNPEVAEARKSTHSRLIARSAPPGGVLMSRQMALTLALEAPDLNWESFGSIGTVHGEVSVSILNKR